MWPDPRDVVQSPGVIPKMSVLDLCCGDGYFTAPLAKLVGGNVYALDLDPLMIELAKAEVARLHTSVLKWICADARDAPQHITESVDYILMANTFHGAGPIRVNGNHSGHDPTAWLVLGCQLARPSAGTDNSAQPTARTQIGPADVARSAPSCR